MQLLKKSTILLSLFIILSTLTFCETKKEKSATDNSVNLPRVTPESQGVSSEVISNFIDELNKSGTNFHSLMIVRNGNVIAEGWWDPYKPEYKHQLYSLSKAFTSTAIGIAVKEGLLTVDDQVISFFPEELPDEISENLASLKVKHLLTMSIGLTVNADSEIRKNPTESWVKTILSLPIENTPGTKFKYASANTFLLSAIIQKLTGGSMHKYLTPRLFEPLNITDSEWMENPHGINMAAFGLRVKTEDIAKLGQLYLQKGEWNDQQILTKEWVEAGTQKQIASSGGDGNFDVVHDWSSGYGYKFWMNTVGGYRADGAYGQYSIVIPEKNLVVAITEETFSMAETMDLIWEHLLPEIQSDVPLEENSVANNNLVQKLNGLQTELTKSEIESTLVSSINGKTFVLEDNQFEAKSVVFNFTENAVEFIVTEKDGTEISVDCGFGEWIVGGNEKTEAESLFPVPGRIDFASKMAASAMWNDEQTLVLTWRFLENVHGDSMTFTFEDDAVTIQFLNSEAKGKNNTDPRTDIIGH